MAMDTMRAPRDVAPPIPIGNVGDLNAWLRRFEGVLYWQPDEMIDAADLPEWLSEPSIAVTTNFEDLHSIELRFDLTPEAPTMNMNLFLSFGSLDVFDERGQFVAISEVIGAVDAWWRDMREGGTGGQFGIVPGRAWE
jgi:hypothetical protein